MGDVTMGSFRTADSIQKKRAQSWPLRISFSHKLQSDSNPLVAVASLVSLFTNDLLTNQMRGLLSHGSFFLKESSHLHEFIGRNLLYLKTPKTIRVKKKRSEKVMQKSEPQLSQKAVSTSKHLACGAIAAMLSRTAVAPLERLKLEYMVRGTKTGIVTTLQNIMQTEGLSGFWQGNAMNLIRTAPFKSLNYFAFDNYRKFFLKLNGRSEISNIERIASGAAAGVTATVLCYPLDTLRTRMIVTGGFACRNIIATCSHLIRTEGILSLYRGLLPSVISMAPGGAVFYSSYDFLRSNFLRSSRNKNPALRHNGETDGKLCTREGGSSENRRSQMELGPTRTLLYGAIAGAAAEIATYPFEVVRRQMQLQGSARTRGLVATVSEIVRKDGPAALYAGILPSLLQVLPSAALSYFVYEFLKAELKIQ